MGEYQQAIERKNQKLLRENQEWQLKNDIFNRKVFVAEEMIFLVVNIRHRKILWTSPFKMASWHFADEVNYWSFEENKFISRENQSMVADIYFQIGNFIKSFVIEGGGALIVRQGWKTIFAAEGCSFDSACGFTARRLIKVAVEKEHFAFGGNFDLLECKIVVAEVHKKNSDVWRRRFPKV